MSNQPNETLVRQFSDQVHVQAQQMKARLRPFVEIKKVKGNDYAYDGMGDVEATEIVGRNQPTQFSDIEHLRRKIPQRRYAVALPIDPKDLEETLLDTQSNYASSVARAIERQFDRTAIEAMFADVRTGREFENTVDFATDGVINIDATGGLTYDILTDMQQGFIDNEVGNDMPEQFVLGISGDEHKDLMNETNLTSGDFSRQMVVDKGSITFASGFELIKYGASVANPMLPIVGGERIGFAMSTRAICVGIGQDINIRIDKREDLNYTTQVYADFTIGAVRTEGKLIQRVRLTP